MVLLSACLTISQSEDCAKLHLHNVPNCLNRELGGSVIVSDYRGMNGE